MFKKLTAISLFLFSVSILQAQSYTGKQHSFSLDTDQMMTVYSGDGNLEKASSYYFKMTFPEAIKAIKAKGVNPGIEEGTIFVDGKKFRFDSRDEGEKMSMIMNLETGKMYSVFWAKKEFMEIDIEKMKKMREQIKTKMAAQMQGMGAYMDKLPPEVRKKMEAMQKGQMPEDIEAEVSATGRTKTVNNFQTKEFIVRKENKIEQVWASKEYPELMKMFKNMEITMADQESSKNDLWDKIDGWPVHQIEIEMNMMHGQGSVSFDEVYSIKKATHKQGTFVPPAGFKRTTMEESFNSFNR